jgi:hypothetical protein
MASKPKMPAVQPPTRMPLPDDAQAKAARKRAQAALAASGGRESTDLTDNGMTSDLGL